MEYNGLFTKKIAPFILLLIPDFRNRFPFSTQSPETSKVDGRNIKYKEIQRYKGKKPISLSLKKKRYFGIR